MQLKNIVRIIITIIFPKSCSAEKCIKCQTNYMICAEFRLFCTEITLSDIFSLEPLKITAFSLR